MSNRMDNMWRVLGTLAVVAVTIAMACYAFMHSNYLLMALLLSAAPMVALINNPSAWLVAIIAVSQSNLILPGLPRGLQVFHVLAAGFSMLILARNILLKPAREQRPWSFVWVCGLLLVLGLIVVQRGLGFLSMGGDLIGGASYIQLFIACMFLFASRSVMLTTRQWKTAVVLMIVFSMLPVLAQLVFTATGGTSTFLYRFIEFYGGVRDTLTAVQTGTQVERYQTLSSVADGLLMGVLIFTTRRHDFRLITYVGIGICFILAGLTGFRSLILQFLVIVVMFRLFIAPKHQRAHLLLLSVASALFLCILLIPFTEHLPQSMQRAFSWLPYAQIDAVASSEATATVSWRVELWKYCWEHVPEYLWLGRGFAMSITDLTAYSVFKDEILSTWYSHNYHNGPLSVLLDTGLVGLVCVSLFFVFSTREVLRTKRIPEDLLMYRFFTVMKVKFLYSVFSFIFIHGDVRSSLGVIFFNLAILYCIQVTDSALSKKRVERTFALVDPSFGTSTSGRISSPVPSAPFPGGGRGRPGGRPAMEPRRVPSSNPWKK